MPEDIATYHVELSRQASLTSIHAAMAEKQTTQKVQTDRQTDGFSALYT